MLSYKKAIGVVLGALLVVISGAHSESTNPLPDPSVQERFTIMNWGAAPTTEGGLKRIKQCGFTVAGFGAPAQISKETLELCNGLDLQVFIWPRHDEIDALSRDPEVGGNPAVKGFVIGSEFSLSKFPEMAAAVEVFKANQPEKIPLMCLFPPYAALEALGIDAAREILGKEGESGAQNYQSFLNQFVETCKPKLLCYDAYTLMENGTMNPVYWTCLEIFRSKSLEARIPFWNIIQALGSGRYREPSAADLRFQAYTTMAYGGKGIVYFSYKAYPVGNYREAAVDQYGNETPTWQRIQNTNAQINQLSPTLMKLRNDGAYHFGDVPEGCHGPSAKSLVQGIDGNILVGDFTHEDGSRYVMLVNKDFSNSVICWPKFRDPSVEAEKVSIFNGKLVPLHYEERWIAPGQGMLLKLIKKKSS